MASLPKDPLYSFQVVVLENTTKKTFRGRFFLFNKQNLNFKKNINLYEFRYFDSEHSQTISFLSRSQIRDQSLSLSLILTSKGGRHILGPVEEFLTH